MRKRKIWLVKGAVLGTVFFIMLQWRLWAGEMGGFDISVTEGEDYSDWDTQEDSAGSGGASRIDSGQETQPGSPSGFDPAWNTAGNGGGQSGGGAGDGSAVSGSSAGDSGSGQPGSGGQSGSGAGDGSAASGNSAGDGGSGQPGSSGQSGSGAGDGSATSGSSAGSSAGGSGSGQPGSSGQSGSGAGDGSAVSGSSAGDGGSGQPESGAGDGSTVSGSSAGDGSGQPGSGAGDSSAISGENSQTANPPGSGSVQETKESTGSAGESKISKANATGKKSAGEAPGASVSGKEEKTGAESITAQITMKPDLDFFMKEEVKHHTSSQMAAEFFHSDFVPQGTAPVITVQSESVVAVLSLRLNGREASWHWEGNDLVMDTAPEKNTNRIELTAVLDGEKILSMEPWEF